MMDSSLMKNPMDSVIKQLRKARNILGTSKTDWRTAMAGCMIVKEFLAMKVYGTKEFPSKKHLGISKPALLMKALSSSQFNYRRSPRYDGLVRC